MGWADLEVLLILIALVAVVVALVVAISEWWLTVPPAAETPPEPGALSFETPWLSMLPEFGGGPGRGRQIRVHRHGQLEMVGRVADDSQETQTLGIGTISAERVNLGVIDMRGWVGVAEPPTSACSRCGRTFPVADLYTGQRSGRQACEGCLTAMVTAGVAKRPAEF